MKYQPAIEVKRRIDYRPLWMVPIIVVRHLDLTFAEQLIDQKALPQGAFADAVHIAVAARRAIPYWQRGNSHTLANSNIRSKVEQICHHSGYLPPCIDTPEVILEETHV